MFLSGKVVAESVDLKLTVRVLIKELRIHLERNEPLGGFEQKSDMTGHEMTYALEGFVWVMLKKGHRKKKEKEKGP